MTSFSFQSYNKTKSSTSKVQLVKFGRSISIYVLTCIAVWVTTFYLTLLYTSVFYHRAFTHRSIILAPKLKKFILITGNWLTGIEPKTWICMHRRHHLFADKPLDPHSPKYHSILSILWVQLKSYEITTQQLEKNNRDYTRIVKDLDFPVHYLNRSGLWFIPHLLHLGIAIVIAIKFDATLLGACYWLGMNSHPVQGWLVNAFGHSKGYRNFNTPDISTNNLPVGYLVMGEGFQNNHHQDSRQANFGVKWWEIDTGYTLCKILSWMKLLTFNPRVKIRPHRLKPVV